MFADTNTLTTDERSRASVRAKLLLSCNAGKFAVRPAKTKYHSLSATEILDWLWSV